MVFHWSLSDCKYPQVSRTLLSILVDFSNAVIWSLRLSSNFQLIQAFVDRSEYTHYNWYHRHFHVP